MEDEHDDRVMTDFLLGVLDNGARARVFERLGSDEAFFERVAALEDDLILRWHRGELPARQHELFELAYSEPSRRTRVDSTIALINAAEAWRTRQGAGLPKRNRIADWARAPGFLHAPGWTTAAVAIALIACVAAYLLIAVRPEEAAAPFTSTFRLTAAGERGSAAAKGFDSVILPRNATAIELIVVPSGVLEGGRFTAEIASVDRGTALETLAPILRQSVDGPTLAITVPSDDLPDGDYVLTVRQVTTHGSEVVSRQPFRLVRPPK